MAQMRRSKAHHYVPEVLQKAFTVDGENLWFSKRDENGSFKKIDLKNKDKAFVKRNYNTIIKDGERSDIYERVFYGNVDQYLGTLLPEIFSIFERGGVPKFSGPSLDSLRRIVLVTATRSPDFHKRFDEVGMAREMLLEILEVEKERLSPSDLAELQKDLSDPQRLRDLGRTARVRGSAGRMKRAEKVLRDFSVKWAIAPSFYPFILSSKAVYRIGNGGPNGLKHKKMEMWMPLSPKICVILVRDKRNKLPLTWNLSVEKVMEINSHITYQSLEIGGSSREILDIAIRQAKMMEQ